MGRFLLRIRKLALVAICAASAACAPAAPLGSPRPIDQRADPAEYARFGPGSLELKGQAFLTTRGGDVKLAAGRLVTLDPMTSYSREWFRRFGTNVPLFDLPAPDSLFMTARKTTTANAEGRFHFSRLSPGDYIVRTVVTWETGGYDGRQGGVVASLVTVAPDENKEVILNEVYTPDLTAMLGVTIVEPEALSARWFRVIGKVKGISCYAGAPDQPANEKEARKDIILNAARRGADAVSSVTCRKLGLSVIPNCSSRVECEGDAIAWGSGS